MRIVFSKDRPAQLDLLLRSLERYASGEDEWPHVLYTTSTRHFGYAYDELMKSAAAFWLYVTPERFDEGLRLVLGREDLAGRADETVTFFCDDDVVFRPIPYDPRERLRDPLVLTFSWRLGRFVEPEWQTWIWDWRRLPRTDHGYPGSIDGHTFRTSDVQEMIGSEVIANPTMLETVLALGCEKLAERRPLMAAWPEQVLVGVPVNRVSEQSGCPNGERFPQPVEELNRRFLAGERISLDALDFSGVAGCHHELQYEWE